MKEVLKKALALAVMLGMAPFWLFAITPNDTQYHEQWYLERIDAPDAWDIQVGSEEVIIAVLDTGVVLDHPDIVGNIWINEGEIPGNGIDDDGNGYIDDVYGWDFVDDDNDPSPDMSSGYDADAAAHGTAIAGLASATTNNGEGVAGVSWNSKIMAVRMLDKTGAGNSVDARMAIEYAVANGADIINMSFSGSTNDPALERAIQEAYEAGVIIVAALGNEGININSSPVYPACYEGVDEDWVIGVVATNEYDKRSSFSNYGTCADISAPGEDLYGLYSEDYTSGWSGTSVASPLVAGAAALLLSEYPALTPLMVRNILKLSVDPITVERAYRGLLGSGRLNVGQALTLAASYVAELELEDPVDEDGDQGEDADELIETYTANFIKSDSFPTVYYVTENNNRRPFLSTTTYFTWSDTFSDIQEVSDEALAQYQIDGLMLPRAGVVLVKIMSDPTVYALETQGNPLVPALREIPNEDIAIAVYGASWSDYVIDIEPTFFTRFDLGEPIDSAYDVDRSILKTREDIAHLAQ